MNESEDLAMIKKDRIEDLDAELKKARELVMDAECILWEHIYSMREKGVRGKTFNKSVA